MTIIQNVKLFLLKYKNRIKRHYSKNISGSSFLARNVQIFGLDNILIQDNCTIGEFTILTINNRSVKGTQLSIGNNTYIGRSNFFSTGKAITIKDYCIFGNNCSLICSDHIFQTPLVPYSSSGNSCHKSITVGVNCWFGDSVTILGDVNIGHGCIIGANSLVTKDIPPFSMAVGNPAKILKTFNFDSNSWELGKQDIDSIYNDENTYLMLLKSNRWKLSAAYHSASFEYGDL